jgi:hypothetical protein
MGFARLKVVLSDFALPDLETFHFSASLEYSYPRFLEYSLPTSYFRLPTLPIAHCAAGICRLPIEIAQAA